MATKKDPNDSSNGAGSSRVSASVEELLLSALERGDESLQTGRFLVTFKEGAGKKASNPWVLTRACALLMPGNLKVRPPHWKVLVMPML
ncbi:MAG: hypothetical protein WKF97_04555 [Chitinophagaceae bacterium]